MSESKDSSADNTAAARSAATDEPGPAAAVATQQPGSGRSKQPTGRTGLALFSLLLSLAALGLSSWLWWQHLDAGQAGRIDSLAGEAEARALDMEGLQLKIEEQARQLENLHSEIEDRLQEFANRTPAVDQSQLMVLEQGNERIEARQNALEQDVNALEQAVSSQIDALDARFEEVPSAQPETDFDELIRQHRRTLVLHEAAAMLRIGQSLAELGDDLSGARQAYAQAAARLSTLDDRRASTLRQAIVGESELLAASGSGLDFVEVVARLVALSSSAADWPLIDEQVEAGSEIELTETDDADGWLRGIGRALGSLVRVTPREHTALPELVVESQRERIRLYLAAAEAAAARRNAAELAQHAQAALELLDARFNKLDPAVARAHEVLVELARSTASEQLDLGAALAEIERSLEAR